ncbi:MAG: S8 family serine peptidase [Rubrobacter sp.]
MRSEAYMRYTVALAALVGVLCLLVSAGFSGPARAIEEGDDYEVDEVVVKLDPAYRDPATGQPATIEEINAAYGTTTKEVFLRSGSIYLLALPTGSDEEGKSLEIEGDPRVAYAEPNFIAGTPEGDARMRARGVVDEAPSTQYAQKALNLSCARKVDLGAGARVAILDTGAQLNHPALKDNFHRTKKYDFVDDDTNPSEAAGTLRGHGTHVAGIVDLVAPKARIMPLRVLDAEGSGNAFVIAEAVWFAQNAGADVINLSLGGPMGSELLQDVIGGAVENGVVVAAAAGNESTFAPHYPAAGGEEEGAPDGLLAVTSVDRHEKKSDFANYGPWVEVAAPGTSIRSAFPVGDYATWSGTSMATPFVAGQAALIEGANGSLNAADTEALIQQSARPLDAKNPAHAGALGAGHADIGASLERLQPGACS